MARSLSTLLRLVLAAPLLACGSTTASSSDAGDASGDAYVALSNDATDDFAFDIPVVGDSGTTTECTLAHDADPVALCVQKVALESLHAHAFVAKKGAAASWSSVSGNADPGDGGTVTYSLDDTAAYAAAATNYLASAEQYGDTTIDRALESDLQAVALLFETSFSPPATEYSGDLYFHLRTIAEGLRAIQLDTDATKFDALAETYGRSILSAHYVELGSVVPPVADAGHHDAGKVDASVDAGKHDAGATIPDGIFGNTGSDGRVTYATGDVATAAYALLDLVARNPSDSLVPAWLRAARASLLHLQAQAIEPTTGMFYASLVTRMDGDAGTRDVLAPATDPTVPADAVLADVQATFAWALVRAASLVASNTVTHLNGADGSGAITDGGVTGPFVSILDLPLEGWVDATLQAMNGAHSLWDGPLGATGLGYVDGYVPSTHTLLTTKSTRPNALLAGVLERAYLSNDILYYPQLGALIRLLRDTRSASVPLHSGFFTILSSQSSFLRGGTQKFEPLTTGANPTSYTTAAVSAVVEGLTEQLVPASP